MEGERYFILVVINRLQLKKTLCHFPLYANHLIRVSEILKKSSTDGITEIPVCLKA